MHEGHRQRMLKRLEKNQDSLQDHELLEILLFNAIPRKNTNEIAHNLLAAFGSLDGMFRADFNQLRTVEGIGNETASFLKCISICMDRIRFDVKKMPERFNFESYSTYLMERYRGLNNEFLEIFSLDSSERIKSHVRYSSSQNNKVILRMSEVSEFIVSHKPFGIVIAHNHPFVKSVPSKEDDAFTLSVKALCNLHGIRFYDHAIAGSDGVFSYFRSGRLDNIALTIEGQKQ